MVLARESKIC